MASDEALEVSTQPREASMVQQREISMEATSSHGVESDSKSRSGDSRDSKTAPDNSGHLKVAAAATLARITYDFCPYGITKARIGSMDNYMRYFPKGHGRAPGAELVLEPRANKAVVFDEFFTVGLHMPPHPVLVDILRKF
jgi:hypothetical protein